MSAREKVIKIGLPFLVVIIALGLARVMIMHKKAPEQKEKIDRGALVEFMTAEKGSHRIQIRSTGTVQPRQEVTISPQVSGNVVSLSPRFAAGEFFRKGETLFTIEKIDYELALEQARAALAKREFELSTVESKASIARKEWERLQKDRDVPPNPLALYEPQLKDAKANLASAGATVRQAELNLARTTITAPFNCVVRSENIDKGQYVRSGNNVAVIAGTDTSEVVVPVELSDLQWLEIPASGKTVSASPATIVLESGNRIFSWPGKIERLMAEVDPQGRMARLVLSIQDPYLLKGNGAEGQPPLAIGSFVDVIFQGKEIANVYAIPRPALRDDNTVWLIGSDNLLKVKKVEPVRLEREEVFLSAGLETGDRVILTNLTGAADGMKLRPDVGSGQQGGE